MLPGLCPVGAAASVAPPVTLTDRTVSKLAGNGATAVAIYEINSDGTVRNHNGTILETWLPAGALATNYQVRAVDVGSTPPGGSLGVWLSCSSTRSWSETASGGEGLVSGGISVQIRDAAAPNTIRATATITINATSDP